MRARGPSRREFLRTSALVGAGIAATPLLAACTDPADVKQLTFLNWNAYIAPQTLPGFQRASGIDVVYDTYTSNDELQKRLHQAQRRRRGGRQATAFDLMVPSDYVIPQLKRDDDLERLDRSSIPNLQNLTPEARAQGVDPGNRYTVPWASGTTGIGYDTKVFSSPPTWDVFLDPRFKNRMTILNEQRDALAVGLFATGADPNTTSPKAIDAATDELLNMKKVIRGFDSSDSYWEDLASGKLVAVHAYSSDLLQAKERNPNLEFTLPREGALRWVDEMAIPTDATHKANAEKFMNYVLRPEVSARISEFVQVDTLNSGAAELLPAQVLRDPVIFPPEAVLDRLDFTEDLGPANSLYSAAWDRVRA